MSTAGSEGETPVNDDNAPMPHETAGGKADPGLKFLKEIILTAEEEQEYTRIAREGIPGTYRGVLARRKAQVPTNFATFSLSCCAVWLKWLGLDETASGRNE